MFVELTDGLTETGIRYPEYLLSKPIKLGRRRPLKQCADNCKKGPLLQVNGKLFKFKNISSYPLKLGTDIAAELAN